MKKTWTAEKEKTENKLHAIPLRITDTTLRDAHQSLWATRMRTDDIIRIIDLIDNVGYYSLECWGGATFDVCLRFLRENPWERLRLMKAKAKKTPLQMLLRGQNLVGYRNYPDDVVDRFVSLSCENGIDIFRVFDALNDTRNLEAAVRAVKKYGGHAQGTLCYTISPVHTVEKFVQYAKEQVAVGIDSLCIKDMAGILSPIGAERLVSALVEQVGVPIQLHCHATSGMATATYVEGVRAGAGAIDCAVSSMADFSSQPPVETLSTIFSETKYSAGLDLEAIEKIAKYFADLQPSRRQGGVPTSAIDPAILIHQIPGGMISNFRSQLSMQNALDKLPLALEEVTKVREDLGWPPLVTPTSQIVGTQAALNVLAGERYKMVPNEVKDYVRGLYGRSPAAMSAKFIKSILGDEKPVSGRPADKFEPMLPKATEGLDTGLIEHEEDIVSYCMLPEPAAEYFKWRKLPAAERPETPADLELKKSKQATPAAAPVAASLVAPAMSVQPVMPVVSAQDYQGVSQILAQASAISFEHLTVQKGDFSVTISANGSAPAAGPRPVVVVQPAVVAAAQAATPATTPAPSTSVAPAAAPAATGEYAHTVKAPLVGTFYASPGRGKGPFVKVGDVVKSGDKVCIVEAMKLFNEITIAQGGKIVAILATDGQLVEKGQPLVAFEPA
jgi:oxaloacetate decarboxylase alpha subunit